MSVNLGGAYGKIEIDTSGVTRSVQAAVAAMSTVSQASKGMSGGLAAVSKDAKAFESSFSGVGMALVGVSGGLVAAGGASLKIAKDFQTSMSMFSAVSGATAEQMKKVGDTAKELGADITLPNTSALNAALAMTELAKAGLSVDDTLKAVKGTIQLATAGNLSEARSAEIAANALNSFHLQGSEATRVANLLAAGANASSAEVTDMADSLAMSSAVFASADIKIEDLVAAIGEMANAGIKGSDSGTSLKQMLLKLEAPTDQAKGLMQELGINIYDAQGKMLPFREIIQNFTSSMSGLTQEQRNEALATIFGSDAIRAANIVMVGGVGAFDAMRTAVTREGAAADLAGARMKGLNGALENLKSQAETAGLAIGDKLSGSVEHLINQAANLVAGFNNLAPAQQNFVTGALAVTAALTGAVGGFILIAPKIVMAVGAMGQFITYGKEVVTGLQLMKAGFGAAEVASTGFAGTMAVALPVLLAVTAALYAAYKAYELHVEVMKRTEEVGGAYASMLNDQVAAGKSAEDIMVEYAATQDRVNKAYEAAPWYLKPFIDKQSLITAGAKEYVKTLGETTLSQSAYEAEMRKAADSMGLEIDATGNLVKVTQAMGATNTEVVQSNYLLTESQRSQTAALRDTTEYTADFTVEQLRANKTVVQATQDLDKDTKAADELRDAQAQLADSALDIAKTFATANEKYTERADLTQKLKDLDAQVISQGTAHTEVIKKRTMSDDDLNAAISKQAAIQEDVVKIQRKKKESDRELAARLDGLKASYSDLGTKIGEANGTIGAHIGVVGGATKAQVEERKAILDKIAAMDLEMQKEMATQAVESLTPEMFGTGAEAAAKYEAAKRGLMLATGLVTQESLAEKDAFGILTNALATGMITPDQYAAALGRVRQAAADGKVSFKELTDSLSTTGATDQLVAELNSMPSRVSNPAQKITSQFLTELNSVPGLVSAPVKRIADQFTTELNSIPSSVSAPMKQAGDAMVTNLTGPLDASRIQMQQAGLHLATGISEGITSQTAAMGAALIGSVDGSVAQLRAAYGMESPSMVMAGYGQDLMAGLVMGASGGSATSAALSAAFTSVIGASVLAMSTALQTAIAPITLFNTILDATNLRMAGPGGMVPNLQNTTLESSMTGIGLMGLSTMIATIVNPSFDATNTKLLGAGGVIPNLQMITAIAAESMATIGAPLSNAFIATANSLQLAAQMGNALADVMREIKGMNGLVVRMTVVTTYATVGSAPAGATPSAPTFAMGGFTGAGGPAILHPREFVLSEEMRRGLQPIPQKAMSPEAIAKLVGQGGKAGAVITDNRVTHNNFYDSMSTKMWLEKERMDQIASVQGAM